MRLFKFAIGVATIIFGIIVLFVSNFDIQNLIGILLILIGVSTIPEKIIMFRLEINSDFEDRGEAINFYMRR